MPADAAILPRCAPLPPHFLTPQRHMLMADALDRHDAEAEAGIDAAIRDLPAAQRGSQPFSIDEPDSYADAGRRIMPSAEPFIDAFFHIFVIFIDISFATLSPPLPARFTPFCLLPLFSPLHCRLPFDERRRRAR